mmetsp:Transcript_88108/g.139228  ORF Transcript_88108/g.139228 Transcript_88108/m.139228 type:complete len:81 (+) Transcript_88108:100-342(+)
MQAPGDRVEQLVCASSVSNAFARILARSKFAPMPFGAPRPVLNEEVEPYWLRKTWLYDRLIICVPLVMAGVFINVMNKVR